MHECFLAVEHGSRPNRSSNLYGILDHESIARRERSKLRKALDEFDTYIVVNQPLIPNYGERWRNKKAIATGFVESAVNQIVSKRFSKKQQMQWTKKGAHLVLQMRTRVLDERLEDTFRDWYPDFRTKPLKVRSSRRLKHPDFYALHRGAVQDPHRAHDADPLGYPKMITGIVNMTRPDGTQTRA